MTCPQRQVLFRAEEDTYTAVSRQESIHNPTEADKAELERLKRQATSASGRLRTHIDTCSICIARHVNRIDVLGKHVGNRLSLTFAFGGYMSAVPNAASNAWDICEQMCLKILADDDSSLHQRVN
jgi:hypothetical protein